MTDYADLEKRLRAGDLTRLNETADALAALARKLEAYEVALKPFSEFARWAVDVHGWQAKAGAERISDWFGPSEFRNALTAQEHVLSRDDDKGDAP